MSLSYFQIAFRWFACTAFLLLLSVKLRAQNQTGTIDGVVHDSSGAIIPNALVTITNTGQDRIARRLKTSGQGEFTAPLLAIGEYSVAVEALGFQATTVSHIEVHVSQPASVPVILLPAETAQTVTVTANSVAPQLDTAAAGTLIDETQVRQLSLSSRNYEQLMTLQPGISEEVPGTIDRGIISTNGGLNPANFQVNGQRPTQDGYFLDGQDILDHGGSIQSGLFPSIDAIQEMSLLRNSYGAQFGGSGSVIVSMETRSGTTDFHGGAYEFFRSQILDANNYFNNLVGIARPGIRYNDYGYELGGPLWIPNESGSKATRTFFFFGQELLREETQISETLTNIPTAAQRQGIFHAPVCVAYTNETCTQSTTSISHFDSTALAYLTDIIDRTPLPNSPSDPQGLIATEEGFNNETQTFIRIDRQFYQKLSVFFRYLDDPFHLVVPNGLYQLQGVPGVGTSAVTDGATTYLGHATYTISPNTVLDGGYSYMPIWITALPIGLVASVNSPDIKPSLPYVSTLDRVPDLTINGGAYSATGPYVDTQRTYQMFLNITHSVGRHTLDFGGNVEDMVSGNNPGTTNAGAFIFSAGALPTGSTATQFDQSFADFLLGHVSSFEQTSVDAGTLVHENLYEGYVQDDFHASATLMLNGGVRYSFIQQPDSKRMGNYPYIPLTNFDPSFYSSANAPAIGATGLICSQAPCPGGGTPNPSSNPLNGMIVSGQTSPFGSAVNSQPALTFAPRVGFAWDVLGNAAMALRGGFGIYYIQNPLDDYRNMAQVNPPYVTDTVISNTSFDKPGNGVPAAGSAPLVLYGTSPHTFIPYVQDWSLDLQQHVAKSTVLDMGYYGNRSVHQIGMEDMNQPFPGEYAQKGIIPGDGITTANSTLLNQIRPFRGWGPINNIAPIFFSNYHSLQISVVKRFSDDSVLNLDYTWSKALTDNQTDSATPPQNIYNLAAEYGPAQFNRANVLSANFVYQLPFCGSQRGIVGHALGGWETEGIISYGSGFPLTAETINVDPGGLGLLAAGSATATNNTGRPDAVSNPNKGAPHKVDQWFNSAAFAQVPAGQYRPGNAPVGDIVGPGYADWDLSLFKNLHFVNSLAMQFRVEAFNTFNHTNFVNFNGVATILGQTDFGQVTGADNARILQLGTKINF